MANDENLKPIRSESEAREKGRNGGIKSGEARRRKRDAQKAAKWALGLAVPTQLAENLQKLIGVDFSDETMNEAIMATLLIKASKGSESAIRQIYELAGETPSQKLAEKRYQDEKKKETKQTSNAVDDWISAVIEVDGEENGNKQ